MGTTFEVTVYRTELQKSLASIDLEIAYQRVAEVDQLMSLYRADSELVAINEQAGKGKVPVSAKMFDILGAAQHYARLSDAAIDITIQPLVELWGFYQMQWATVPPLEKIDSVLKKIGIDRIELDIAKEAVSLHEDSRLDLGSIAKGYAVDQAVAALRARGVPAALVNLGGNIGVLGLPPGKRPWTIGIKHPREERLIGEVRFWHGAVATSGDYYRYFEVNGKRYSHLLDPRSGWPVQDIASFTVVAPNATAADALSTAAMVLGPVHGVRLLHKCANVDGLLLKPKSSGKKEIEYQTKLDLTEPAADKAPNESVSFVLEAKTSRIPSPKSGQSLSDSAQKCIWPIRS